MDHPTIATLGPAGTFSDLAARHFKEQCCPGGEIVYCANIKRVFQEVGRCDWCVVPIENMSEGFVQLSLDQLLLTPSCICYEMMLPIHFDFVSSCADPLTLEKLYVQFVTQGQCLEFIDKLGLPAIIQTASNIESLKRVQDEPAGAGAIVPHHAVTAEMAWPWHVENVNDFKNNATRFIVLGKKADIYDVSKTYKTSLIVLDEDDKPGLLCGILTEISKNNINMTSIISRPTKAVFGKYHFFIDFEGHCEQPAVRDMLARIQKNYHVKMVGSYPCIDVSGNFNQ